MLFHQEEVCPDGKPLDPIFRVVAELGELRRTILPNMREFMADDAQCLIGLATVFDKELVIAAVACEATNLANIIAASDAEWGAVETVQLHRRDEVAPVRDASEVDAEVRAEEVVCLTAQGTKLFVGVDGTFGASGAAHASVG